MEPNKHTFKITFSCGHSISMIKYHQESPKGASYVYFAEITMLQLNGNRRNEEQSKSKTDICHQYEYVTLELHCVFCILLS